MAALQARAYILPDDIKQVAVAALAHRLILGSSARVREVDSRAIVLDILASVPVPGGELRG
jgi:MoxR-like ATPase